MLGGGKCRMRMLDDANVDGYVRREVVNARGCKCWRMQLLEDANMSEDANVRETRCSRIVVEYGVWSKVWRKYRMRKIMSLWIGYDDEYCYKLMMSHLILF